MNEQNYPSGLGSVFDRTIRALKGLPDVVETKTSTVRTFTAIKDEAETWIVQTFRHRERGDTAFIEYVGPEGTTRIAMPPAVMDTISRQRDALTGKNRRTAAKNEAARRKAAGILPGFMRKPGKRKPRKKAD